MFLSLDDGSSEPKRTASTFIFLIKLFFLDYPVNQFFSIFSDSLPMNLFSLAFFKTDFLYFINNPMFLTTNFVFFI